MLLATVAPPRPPLVQRLNNPALFESDRNVVRDYVKKDLFERLVFIWDERALATNGALYRSYTANCRSLIADGQLVNASDEEANTYMELLWTMMMKDENYPKWLQQKRSNAHQAMADKFRSKLSPIDTKTSNDWNLLDIVAQYAGLLACHLLLVCNSNDETLTNCIRTWL